jgi:hypothetical protein
LASGRIATIRDADGATDTETTFGEIETIAHSAADAVVFAPFDEVGINSALHDKVFNEATYFIIYESGSNGSAVAEAFTETTSDVVFAAAFPDFELTSGADASFTGVEAKHHFTERDLIEGTILRRFNLECHGIGRN